jgi:hypothetical protein
MNAARLQMRVILAHTMEEYMPLAEVSFGSVLILVPSKYLVRPELSKDMVLVRNSEFEGRSYRKGISIYDSQCQETEY